MRLRIGRRVDRARDRLRLHIEHPPLACFLRALRQRQRRSVADGSAHRDARAVRVDDGEYVGAALERHQGPRHVTALIAFVEDDREAWSRAVDAQSSRRQVDAVLKAEGLVGPSRAVRSRELRARHVGGARDIHAPVGIVDGEQGLEIEIRSLLSVCRHARQRKHESGNDHRWPAPDARQLCRD